MESLSDAELVLLCQQGDLRAFNHLVHKCDAGLYRFVRRMMGNGDDARDIVQETMLKAYLNIRRLRDPESFRSWVHRIAVNLCRDWHRAPRARKETTTAELSGLENVADAGGAARTAAEAAERSSLATLLAEFLERISPAQRTAILLREYHGFSMEEIARITGVGAPTVRTRVFYGLRAIRKMLAERGIVSADLEMAPRPGGGKEPVA
jgi:RNA polymerase sigma-70 factor (ECF subfamily)